MIDNLEKIIQRHQTITNALKDFEGEMAILMGLLQIGETLKNIDSDLLEKFELDTDVKGAYNVRNFIAHDYEGINLAIIEDILRNRLPILQERLKKLEVYLSKDYNEAK